MAKHVLTSMEYLVGGYDLSTDHYDLKMNIQAEEKVCPTFKDTSKARIAGLKTFNLEHTGYWASDGTDEPDDVMDAQIGSTAQVASISPLGGAVAAICYSSKGLRFGCGFGAPIGGMLTFNSAVRGSGVLVVRGSKLATGLKSATASGTAYELGVVSALQNLYGILHVTTATGQGDQTLIVKIQSDTAENFPSPTDRITFTTVTTAVTAQWATPVAGEITDTWWRTVYTMTGTGAESFTIHVIMAIQ